MAGNTRDQTVHTTADDDAEVSAIAIEIEQYLERHPRSKDSLEGIRNWWLARVFLATTTAKVQRALELLVARNVVSKESLPDGRIVYASARKRPSP